MKFPHYLSNKPVILELSKSKKKMYLNYVHDILCSFVAKPLYKYFLQLLH